MLSPDLQDWLNTTIVERADWVVDAVATATQDRRFLRGDHECDEVACEAIQANTEKAMHQLIDRITGASINTTGE